MPLSQLIDVVNERFGTDFNQADQLFFDQIVEAAIADDGLRQAAAVNPEDKFELVFKNLLETLFVERMDQNEEIFVRFMNDAPFQKIVTAWMASEAYRRLRAGSAAAGTGASDRALPPRTAHRRGPPRGALCHLRAARSAQGRCRRLRRPAAHRGRRLRVGRQSSPGIACARACSWLRSSASPWSLPSPTASYCLFRAQVEGTRQGKTVLVQLRDATDPETGQRYTVKRYESEKAKRGDSWRHERITLKPANPDFEPIVLTDSNEDELKVIAEVVEVLAPPG